MITVSLYNIHYLKALLRMLKSLRMQSVYYSFSAMPEGSMPEVVSVSYRFCQVFIYVKRPGYGSRYLRNFDGVRKTSSMMIFISLQNEHLCLMHKPSESLRIDDPIPVPLKIRAKFAWRFRSVPALIFFCSYS